ncbi:hypothetical protein DITRI_Ditri15bG0064200 [Diplodiscus trichospermus]
MKSVFSDQVQALWKNICKARNAIMFDKEEMTSHHAMATLGNCTREANMVDAKAMRNLMTDLIILKRLKVDISPAKAPKIIEYLRCAANQDPVQGCSFSMEVIMDSLSQAYG